MNNINDFIFRNPKIDDLNKVLQFINELADEDVMIASARKYTLEEEKDYLEKLIADIANKRMVCLYVYDKNDNFLGSASIEKNKGRLGHIGMLGIALAKSARGQGLGKVLMNKIINLAKNELEIDQVILTCFAKNQAALSVYKALGFQQYGYLPGAYEYKGERVDQVNMYKKIDNTTSL